MTCKLYASPKQFFVIADENRPRNNHFRQILEFGNTVAIEISVEEGYYGAHGHKFVFLLIHFGDKGEII